MLPTTRTPQGGDVLNDDGSGSFTAWSGAGRRFRDENLAAFKHTAGAVSMANKGPDSNGSQFFVALKVCVWGGLVLELQAEGSCALGALNFSNFSRGSVPARGIQTAMLADLAAVCWGFVLLSEAQYVPAQWHLGGFCC